MNTDCPHCGYPCDRPRDEPCDNCGGSPASSSSLHPAIVEMANAIREEASAKHCCDPTEEGWTLEYGLDITVSVGEAKRFLEAVAEHSQDGRPA